jgi:hypothetical protein
VPSRPDGRVRSRRNLGACRLAVKLLKQRRRLEIFQSRNRNFDRGCVWGKTQRRGEFPPCRCQARRSYYPAAMPNDSASPLALPRRQQGHSREYILERLKREGRVDWIRAIADGRLSCYAAAVELGWTTRKPTKRGPNSNQSKRRRFNIRRLIG